MGSQWSRAPLDQREAMKLAAQAEATHTHED